MFSRFHLILQRHGQTDGRTDRQTDLLINISMLTRDKNVITCFFGTQYVQYNDVISN